MYNVSDIRQQIVDAYEQEAFVLDKTGVPTIELIGTSFVADEPYIIREPNEDYIKREIEWYDSQSRFVEDIPGDTPAIWKAVADENGMINSNYGWCIYSSENISQYNYCLKALAGDRDTRRAIMIYNRPMMQKAFNANGMSDFMCTNSVQYLIRGNMLNAVVNMRSNDAVFGYNNDYAWQRTVLERLVEDYNENRKGNTEIMPGHIFWQTGSIHVYERHFKFIEELINGRD